MFNKVLNLEVSDTTGVENSNADDYIITFKSRLKNKHFNQFQTTIKLFQEENYFRAHIKL